MPHKHKRKRGDDTAFDLPPSQKARPLPVASNKKPVTERREPRLSKTQRKRRAKDDDVPRGFKRLMAAARGKKGRSGLDDGNAGKVTAKESQRGTEPPSIRPGEDLRSFAARVDAALPVSGLAKKVVTKDGKDALGLKVNRTRKERKMHKLYDQWRVEDRKLKEKREEEDELSAEREMDDYEADASTSSALANGMGESVPGKKKLRRRPKDDEDPWLELTRKRAEGKIGLHDVAQAPPELHKKMSQPLRVRGAAVDAADIPKSAGSLRRREELQAVRNDVVEAYRRIREHEQSKLDAQK